MAVWISLLYADLGPGKSALIVKDVIYGLVAVF